MSRGRRERPVAWRQRILLFAGAAILLLIVNYAVFPATRERVIIIGAGTAGLAAAAALSGYASVLVLEAQERIGGRVHTNHSLGAPAELGAAWIHRADGNVVSELARQFGCGTYVSENKRVVIHGESGAPVGQATVTKVYNQLTRQIMPEVLRRRAQLRPDGRDDVSLGSMVTSLESVVNLGGVKRCVLDFLLFRDVVQDHTADLWQTSAARYDTDHYGGSGKDHVLPGGYDCIMNGLKRLSGLRVHAPARYDEVRSNGDDRGRIDDSTRSGIRLGEAGEVRLLKWWAGESSASSAAASSSAGAAAASGTAGAPWGINPPTNGGVEVTLSDGTIERADYAIVTIPLGVLKASIHHYQQQQPKKDDPVISFIPPLPSRVLMAIDRLGYGEALKVALRFPHVFWPHEAHFRGKISGGCDKAGSAQHVEFLNVAKYTDGVPVLLMETESAYARTLAAMSDAAIVRAVTETLRTMFGATTVPEPTGHIVYRMGNNSFQRGGFTYMPVGATHELHRTLATPLANGRLVLAGEHTSSLHAGTVHGALVSGRRAAAHVRAAMRKADVMAAGEEEEERYRARLFASIYSGDDGGGGEEEEWDRNP